MKLWLLQPHDGDATPWQPWYDKNFGFVVRAENEAQARLIASERPYGDEPSDVWLDDLYVSCVELTGDGEPEIILTNFASA